GAGGSGGSSSGGFDRPPADSPAGHYPPTEFAPGRYTPGHYVAGYDACLPASKEGEKEELPRPSPRGGGAPVRRGSRVGQDHCGRPELRWQVRESQEGASTLSGSGCMGYRTNGDEGWAVTASGEMCPPSSPLPEKLVRDGVDRARQGVGADRARLLLLDRAAGQLRLWHEAFPFGQAGGGVGEELRPSGGEGAGEEEVVEE
ncbi:unnamed protein product, partial [Discosporangium mesarthrocarpum]